MRKGGLALAIPRLTDSHEVTALIEIISIHTHTTNQ